MRKCYLQATLPVILAGSAGRVAPLAILGQVVHHPEGVRMNYAFIYISSTPCVASSVDSFSGGGAA